MKIIKINTLNVFNNCKKLINNYNLNLVNCTVLIKIHN